MITLKQARQLARAAVQSEGELYKIPKDFPVYGGASISIRSCGCVHINPATVLGGYILWNDCTDQDARRLFHHTKPLQDRKRIATHFLFALSPYYSSLLKTLSSEGGQGRYFFRNTPERLLSLGVPYPKST